MIYLMHLKGQLRQVKRNLMLFLIPIIIFLFIYLFYSVNKVEEAFIDPLELGLIISEESEYTDILTESFLNSKSFSDFIIVTKDTRDNIVTGFENNEFDVIIEVPAGFVDAVMGFDYCPIEAKINYNDPLKAMIITNALKGYEKYISSAETGIITLYDTMKRLGYDQKTINAYNEIISYELIFTALSRQDLFIYNEVVDIPSIGSIMYFFIAIMVMFLMYISIFSAVNLIREKENHCFERLKIARISIFRYLIGKALATTTFIFIIVILWSFLIGYIGKTSFSNDISTLIIFLIGSIFFDVALTMMITAFIDEEEGVILLTSILIFVNGIIGGSLIPLHIMPDVIQKVAVVSPNYWMIKGFLYFYSGENIHEGLTILAILIGIGTIMLFITSHRYKTRL